MDLFDLPAKDRLALTQACAAEGLDPSYVSFVARHLDAADASWRWCCGSSCDQCVQTLGRAVDRARRALCLQPPGLSSEDAAS